MLILTPPFPWHAPAIAVPHESPDDSATPRATRHLADTAPLEKTIRIRQMTDVVFSGRGITYTCQQTKLEEHAL